MAELIDKNGKATIVLIYYVLLFSIYILIFNYEFNLFVEPQKALHPVEINVENTHF
jgi:hypothetical protein